MLGIKTRKIHPQVTLHTPTHMSVYWFSSFKFTLKMEHFNEIKIYLTAGPSMRKYFPVTNMFCLSILVIAIIWNQTLIHMALKTSLPSPKTKHHVFITKTALLVSFIYTRELVNRSQMDIKR
jgi:hypothetical protein